MEAMDCLRFYISYFIHALFSYILIHQLSLDIAAEIHKTTLKIKLLSSNCTPFLTHNKFCFHIAFAVVSEAMAAF